MANRDDPGRYHLTPADKTAMIKRLQSERINVLARIDAARRAGVATHLLEQREKRIAEVMRRLRTVRSIV